MSFKKRAVSGLFLLTVGSLFWAGCAAARLPIKLDPAFAQRGIRSIALLPAVDQRKDRLLNINLDYEMNVRARKGLEKKGYRVMETAPMEHDRIGISRLMDMDPSYLASLGPADADAVMAIYVQDTLSSYKIMSYVFKVETLGTLVSKADQTEVWRDKGIGNVGQAGLISGLMQGLSRSTALDACVHGMLSTLPKAPAATLIRQNSSVDDNTSRETAIEAAVEQAEDKGDAL